MPPKKKGAPEAQIASDNATVTSKRGTEYRTTAAAGRPRRESAKPPPSTRTTITGESTSTIGPQKRARPAKSNVEDGEPPKKRGRPSKTSTAAAVNAAPKAASAKKLVAPKAASSTPQKRGRPAKVQQTDEKEEAKADAPPAKKRGRPSASKKDVPAVPEAETAPPKKRGRPPTGGETTKITADAGAAAEQLEEELQDTTMEPVEEGTATTTRKRKAPVSQKSKSAKAKAPKNDHSGNDATIDAGQNFWLMKAEQEDREEKLYSGRMFNVKFTIDDLHAKAEPEPWDGVRNAVAAKNMRAMKKGDLAFFYASGGKQGRTPGIVGIMEVVKEHEPDQSAWDKDSYGYVDNEKMRSRWCVVHVEYRKKLTVPVSLAELKKYTKERGALSNMQEFNSMRLSVSKVSADEWAFIVDNLVKGYEEDDDDLAAPATTDLPEDTSEPAPVDAIPGTSNGDGMVGEEGTTIINEQSAPIQSSTNAVLPTTEAVTSDA